MEIKGERGCMRICIIVCKCCARRSIQGIKSASIYGRAGIGRMFISRKV